MDINELNIIELMGPLRYALSTYGTKNVEFKNFPKLVLTPEKPNSARTIVPVYFDNSQVGELYVIAFVRGDGTGDAKTYAPDKLHIPEKFKYSDKPERVIPRAKTGTICEGFFPLFSITPSGFTAMYAASLDELSVDDNRLVTLCRLGLDDERYLNALRGDFVDLPKPQLTVGTHKNKRIGDPHAIHYTKTIEDAVQVVGFLGISDLDNPIMNYSKDWVVPKYN